MAPASHGVLIPRRDPFLFLTLYTMPGMCPPLILHFHRLMTKAYQLSSEGVGFLGRHFQIHIGSLLSASFFFLPLIAFGPFHLLEKKMDGAQTQILGLVLCTFYFGCIMDTTWHNMLPHVHYKLKKQCIIRHKILCLGSTKICWASGQSWEKKERSRLYLPSSSDLTIRIQNNKKLRPHGSTNSSPLIIMISGTCV